jgi:hypothetical protein
VRDIASSLAFGLKNSTCGAISRTLFHRDSWNQRSLSNNFVGFKRFGRLEELLWYGDIAGSIESE